MTERKPVVSSDSKETGSPHGRSTRGMNLKWFVSPVLALAVSVASGSWAKATQEQAPARSQVMGRVVIVGYKPKPGKPQALRSLARTHFQRWRAARSEERRVGKECVGRWEQGQGMKYSM